MLAVWRRERDSNPRCLSTSPVFKTGSLNHSDISPSYSCLDIIAIRHRIVKAFRRKPGKRGDGKGHRPSACRKTSGEWKIAALLGFHRIWRHKVNCPEGTREGPLGGVRQLRKKPCVARVSLHSSRAAP